MSAMPSPTSAAPCASTPNARNTVARSFYRKLGYREIAVVPVTFNGIPGVDLVLLEKYLG